MSVLFWQITNHCMLNCKYCFYKTDGLDYLSKKENIDLRKTVGILVTMGFKHVILTGGDPLHPHIFSETLEIIKLLKDNGIGVSLNSSLATDEQYLFQLMSVYPEAIYVSCDSHLVETHNLQRGKAELTLKNIDILLDHGIKTYVSSVVTKHNYRELLEISNYFMLKGVSEVDFNIAYISEKHSSYSELSCETLPMLEKGNLLNDLLLCVKNSVWPEKQMAFYQYQAKLFLGINISMDILPNCKMGSVFFVLQSNGDLKSCFHSKKVIANLFDEEFDSKHLVSMDFIPDCSGKHCASLFVIDDFWKER